MLKKLLVLVFAFLGVNQLFAFIKMNIVNTQTLEMNLVETLFVSYSSTNIFLLESNDNNLILKEYMTRNRPEYYAKIDNSQGVINIKNGKLPWFIRTRIEIYVPKTFTNNLAVNLRSGNLTANYSMKHKTIDLSVSSGNLRANNISSENVLVDVSSGNITIEQLTGIDLTVKNRSGNININSCQGKINISNRSGNITVNNFVGEGVFDNRSGNINLTLNDVIGDLSLTCSSGNINLVMGRNVSFRLEAEVRSGVIRAPNLGRQVNTKVQHIIGSDPIHKIYAKCGSGNINIK